LVGDQTDVGALLGQHREAGALARPGDEQVGPLHLHDGLQHLAAVELLPGAAGQALEGGCDRGELFGVVLAEVRRVAQQESVGGQDDRVLGPHGALDEAVEEPVQVLSGVVRQGRESLLSVLGVVAALLGTALLAAAERARLEGGHVAAELLRALRVVRGGRGLPVLHRGTALGQLRRQVGLRGALGQRRAAGGVRRGRGRGAVRRAAAVRAALLRGRLRCRAAAVRVGVRRRGTAPRQPGGGGRPVRGGGAPAAPRQRRAVAGGRRRRGVRPGAVLRLPGALAAGAAGTGGGGGPGLRGRAGGGQGRILPGAGALEQVAAALRALAGERAGGHRLLAGVLLGAAR